MKRFFSVLVVFVMTAAVSGCGGTGNAKRHRAMEENNGMVFMYQRINKQLTEWTKAKTQEDKRKGVEKLLEDVKKERAKLAKMKVVDELKPIREEMDRYLAVIQEGYGKILDSYKHNKESDVEKYVNEVNAKLKEIAKNLIRLQEQAASSLKLKINKKMLEKMAPGAKKNQKPAKKTDKPPQGQTEKAKAQDSMKQ